MTNSISESITIPLAPAESNPLPDKGSRFGPLFVRECVPAGAGFTRVLRLHAAYVDRTQEALALPWIQKLPGDKQVRFIHGQVFVIQRYAGCTLIRAHICYGAERRALDLGNLGHTTESEHEVQFEQMR